MASGREEAMSSIGPEFQAGPVKGQGKSGNMSDMSHVKYRPRATKGRFLAAFKYSKTSNKHSFEPLESSTFLVGLLVVVG